MHGRLNKWMAGSAESTRYQLRKHPNTPTPQKCACWAGFSPDQVRKHPKSAPGGQVSGPTRYENRGKVRLVVVLKKWQFIQTPHSKHFTKSLPGLPKAPGTKTPPKLTWWADFKPVQTEKSKFILKNSLIWGWIGKICRSVLKNRPIWGWMAENPKSVLKNSLIWGWMAENPRFVLKNSPFWGWIGKICRSVFP